VLVGAAVSAVIGGDLVVGSVLRRSTPLLPYYAEDIHLLWRSLDLLPQRAPALWHVGHGGPLGLATIHRFLWHTCRSE